MELVTITHFLNGALMIFLPITLGIYLTEKLNVNWKIWLVGGCTFVISQVFHIPFNIFGLNPVLVKLQSIVPGIGSQVIISVLLGLSAGLFEEIARYGMFRWWLRDVRTWRNALVAGAGHGGIEAILVGVLVLLAFAQFMTYRNADLSNLNLTLDQLVIARQQLQAYWNAPWYASMLGAVERVFTIPFHIAASVMVLQVFTRYPGRQQLHWLGLAIFYHALVDGSIVFIANQWGAYISEAVLGGFAILDIIIIFALRQPEATTQESNSAQLTTSPAAFTPTPVEETSENLDKTRFQ